MVDLNGEYRHKVDAKGRLSLPAKFRRELPRELIVTVDPKSECLYVFDSNDFNDWVRSFFERDGGFDQRNALHVAARRELKSRANEAEIDASGRINVPANLREKVGIEKDVVLIGNEGYFEIWDAKRRDDARVEVDLASMLFG